MWDTHAMRLLLALLLALAFACTPARAQDDGGEEPQPHKVDPPDNRVGRELAWVLRVLNGEALPVTLDAKFTPRFIEAYTAEGITTVLTTLRKEVFNGVVIDLVQVNEDEGDAEAVTGVLNAQGRNKFLSVYLALDEKTGLIASLLFNPAGYSCAAGDWETYGGEMGRLGGTVAFGCYELVPVDASAPAGAYKLNPVYEIKEREVLNVAGGFGVWVLGALGDHIAADNAAWSDNVKVQDAWKSMPGDGLAEVRAGEARTLAELAHAMIAKSDLTAADHIARLLGRDAITAYLTPRLPRSIGRNTPFITTREMFALKLAPTTDPTLRFIENDADVRAQMLAPGGDLAGVTPAWDALDAWTNARLLDTVGYFACVEDHCRVMADLHRLEQLTGMAPLGTAMRERTGMDFDREAWPSVAYKGGTEPGALSMAWLLKRSDGRWFVMAAIWNDETNEVAEGRLYDLARAGVNILDKHGRETPTPNGE